MAASNKQRGPGRGGSTDRSEGGQNFCIQCGAERVAGAQFCVECGETLAAGGRRSRPPTDFGRFAPALIVGGVLLLGGAAVWIGARSAAPPAVIPPRGSTPASGELPAGHPPLSIPDDVRQTLDRMVEAAKEKPDDVEMWKQVGFAQYRAGQVERSYLAAAAETYEHVLARRPNDLDALRALGNIAYDREAIDKAIEYYQRYLEQQPDDASVLTDLGTMFLAAQDAQRAIDTYQAVLAADPKFFQAQFNLAIAYRQTGDGDRALEALRRAREVAPDEETRKRVEELLARVAGAPPAAAEGGAAAGPAAGGVQAGVEAIFRSHPIVGPKLDRLEWPQERTAKVLVRDFPMDGMPPQVRERFVERIRGGLREQKKEHSIDGELRVELVDAASGRVMETVVE